MSLSTLTPQSPIILSRALVLTPFVSGSMRNKARPPPSTYFLMAAISTSSKLFLGPASTSTVQSLGTAAFFSSSEMVLVVKFVASRASLAPEKPFGSELEMSASPCPVTKHAVRLPPFKARMSALVTCSSVGLFASSRRPLTSTIVVLVCDFHVQRPFRVLHRVDELHRYVMGCGAVALQQIPGAGAEGALVCLVGGIEIVNSDVLLQIRQYFLGLIREAKHLITGRVVGFVVSIGQEIGSEQDRQHDHEIDGHISAVFGLARADPPHFHAIMPSNAKIPWIGQSERCPKSSPRGSTPRPSDRARPWRTARSA